jgi:hypothetical protein
MRLVGFNQAYYYQVGHSAIVLIKTSTGSCHYFDFGRYHSPLGYGRVRDAETDPELSIEHLVQAALPDRQDLLPVLEVLQQNSACHGSGVLMAACVPINFEAAYFVAKTYQQDSPLRYGPFIAGGTNCSRFVRKVLLAGTLSSKLWWQLQLPHHRYPTPLGLVKAAGGQNIHTIGGGFPVIKPVLPHSALHNILNPPLRPDNVPPSAQWLAGEGAGSWYDLSETQIKGEYRLQRFDASGILESQTYHVGSYHFDSSKPYQIGYLSHAQRVLVLQNHQRYYLFNISQRTTPIHTADMYLDGTYTGNPSYPQ